MDLQSATSKRKGLAWKLELRRGPPWTSGKGRISSRILKEEEKICHTKWKQKFIKLLFILRGANCLPGVFGARFKSKLIVI
jgi:hypothetical protein